MKVLQIGLSHNPGGIESCIMDYYRQLVMRGIQFDFICMYKHLAYEEEIAQLGGKIYYLADVKKHPVQFAIQLAKLLKKEKYRTIHVNMLSAANIVPLIIAKVAHVPQIIIHSHNSNTPGVVRNILHRLNKPFLGCFATHFFACSTVAARWMYSKSLLKHRKISVINNAINVSKFLYKDTEADQIRNELDMVDKLVIGHVGRFEEQKNHDYVIEVFDYIHKKREDAHLLLIGDGELRPEIQEKVNRLGLDSKVHFLGVRKDMDRIWKAIDVFVFPSLFEGLPIVAVEAQAADVKCYFSSTITSKVQITDNVEFLSIKESPSYWGKRILEKTENQHSTERNELIKKQFIEKKYDIQKESEKLIILYKEQYGKKY